MSCFRFRFISRRKGKCFANRVARQEFESEIQKPARPLAAGLSEEEGKQTNTYGQGSGVRERNRREKKSFALFGGREYATTSKSIDTKTDAFIRLEVGKWRLVGRMKRAQKCC